MRLAGLAIALVSAVAACHGHRVDAPAWPAPSTTADDGGESIAPRRPAVAAAIEASEDDADADTDDDALAAKSDGSPAADANDADAPGTDSTDASPQGDVIMSDEIIIEIED